MVKRRKRKLGVLPLYSRVIIYSILTVFGLICLYPLLNVLAKSFSTGDAIFATPTMLWPHDLTFAAYEYIFSTNVLLKSFMITVFATVVGTFMNLLFTIPTAYSLSRIHAPGHKLLLMYIVIPMLFGGGLIPLYILLNNLKLINSVWVLIIPGLISPYNAILMRNFFWSIPDDLADAALMDGASELQVLTRIILPLSKPVIATVGLFHAVGHWNDYFTGLYFINDNTKWPLQVILKSIIIDFNAMGMGSTTANQYMMNDPSKIVLQPENIKAAVIIFSTVPIMMMYPFLQKHFTKGLIIGAIKQ